MEETKRNKFLKLEEKRIKSEELIKRNNELDQELKEPEAEPTI